MQPERLVSAMQERKNWYRLENKSNRLNDQIGQNIWRNSRTIHL